MKWLLAILLLSAGVKAQAYPRVEIDTLIDFTPKDSAALHVEIQILQAVFENDVFWKTILNTEFFCANWRRLHYYRKRNAEYPKWKKDKHLYTSKEIHDLLWFGDDEIGAAKDTVINLKLRAKDYEQKKKGITRHGGTNKNTLLITSNRKTRIHSKKRGEYACHLLHEYLHVLGFKHRKETPSKTTAKCGGEDVALVIQRIGRKIVKLLN